MAAESNWSSAVKPHVSFSSNRTSKTSDQAVKEASAWPSPSSSRANWRMPGAVVQTLTICSRLSDSFWK